MISFTITIFLLMSIQHVNGWGASNNNNHNDVCGSPTDPCMNEENYANCIRIQNDEGCKVVAIHESCPLQFSCADDHLVIGGSNEEEVLSQQPKAYISEEDLQIKTIVSTGQRVGLIFFGSLFVVLGLYVIYLHRELAKVTMYRLLGMTTPLLSSTSGEEEYTIVNSNEYVSPHQHGFELNNYAAPPPL